jgi:V-type H+-transporting ATPase subunit a
MVLPHKYLFALMGFFATYCGFVYNDFLSINLNLFGSCYNVQQAQ